MITMNMMITMSWKKDGGWGQLVLFGIKILMMMMIILMFLVIMKILMIMLMMTTTGKGYESFPERICKVAQKLDYDEYDNDDEHDDDYSDDDDNNDFDFHRQGLRVLP